MGFCFPEIFWGSFMNLLPVLQSDIFGSLLEIITIISKFEMERKQSEFMSWSHLQIVESTLNKSWELSILHFMLAHLL